MEPFSHKGLHHNPHNLMNPVVDSASWVQAWQVPVVRRAIAPMGSPRTPQERVALTRNHDEIAERNRVIAVLRDSMQASVDDFQQSRYSREDMERCISGALAHFCLRYRRQYDPSLLHPFFTQLDNFEQIQREAERQGSRENRTGNPEQGNNPGGQRGQRDVEKELEEVRALVARLEHERVAVAGGEDNGNGDNDDEPVLLQRMSSQTKPFPP